MPTDTLPIFRASNAPGEPAFFIRYPHEGTVYAVGFDSIFELTQTLVNECVEGRLVEQIIDFAEESIEWNAAPPVAEAVCGACDCETCRGVTYTPAPMPRWWSYFAAVTWAGAIALPWVAVVLGIRGLFRF